MVRTADDLRAFVAIAKGGRFRPGFGGAARRAVAAWLHARLDEYQAMKYRGSGEQFSLRNILRLAHPDPGGDEARQAVYRWVVRGEAGPAAPRLAALEDLKAGRLDPDEAVRSGTHRTAVTAVRPPHQRSGAWSGRASGHQPEPGAFRLLGPSGLCDPLGSLKAGLRRHGAPGRPPRHRDQSL